MPNKASGRGSRRSGGVSKGKRWSGRVTKTSHALELDQGVFTLDDPRAMARSLKRSADRRHQRKSEPFRSAMSMLTFHINRGGSQLSARRRSKLEQAKNELRDLYGRPRRD
jgi:hypothetical protein